MDEDLPIDTIEVQFAIRRAGESFPTFEIRTPVHTQMSKESGAWRVWNDGGVGFLPAVNVVGFPDEYLPTVVARWILGVQIAKQD